MYMYYTQLGAEDIVAGTAKKFIPVLLVDKNTESGGE